MKGGKGVTGDEEGETVELGAGGDSDTSGGGDDDVGVKMSEG